MSATIRVPVDRLEKQLLVPSRALIQTGGPSIVYVAGRDGFERAARDGRAAQPGTGGDRERREEGERVALANPEKAGRSRRAAWNAEPS